MISEIAKAVLVICLLPGSIVMFPLPPVLIKLSYNMLYFEQIVTTIQWQLWSKIAVECI